MPIPPPTSLPTSLPIPVPTRLPTPLPTPLPTSQPTAPASPTTAPQPPTTAPQPPTIVTLGFDDNTVDQLAASDVLQSLGIRAMFYVNSGRLDVGGNYMTTAQVKSLEARGHEIGGHTVSHPHLSQLDAAEQRRQICADRSRLLSAGLAVSTFAYPFNDVDAASQAAAQLCGYNSARTLGGLSCRGCDAAEAVPPANLYDMRSISGVTRDTTAAQLMVAVQRAQATGGWLQIAFQHLCSAAPCSSNGIPLHEFETFARWLGGQRGAGALSVSTVHDVLGGVVRPAVAPPAATVTRLQITNSSLEDAGPTPDATRCFVTSTSGDDNAFTSRRVPDRHTGSWAQEIVVTKVRGWVKLQSAQDLGSCAPPIRPQHGYRISVWYKSSAPIAILASSRRQTGSYSSFGTSLTFPAASRWTRAVWTTKGAPVTQNLALSVGVVIKDAGTYVIDDFDVADAGLAAQGTETQGLVDTDSGRDSGQGAEGLFVPSDTAPTVPAGPTAASLKANPRHGVQLILYIVVALAFMWGLVVALDHRFGYLHRRTRTRWPIHR
jgi:hypothetical protein